MVLGVWVEMNGTIGQCVAAPQTHALGLFPDLRLHDLCAVVDGQHHVVHAGIGQRFYL